MAIRTRRYSEARAQAGNNLELAWWVFMRLSGLLLVFLLIGHFYLQNIVINVDKVDYGYVAKQLSQTTWKVYDWLLLSLALLHGTNGTRYVINDYIKNEVTRFWLKALLYAAIFILFLLGSLVLFNYNFQQPV